jgi:hypothetical protein
VPARSLNDKGDRHQAPRDGPNNTAQVAGTAQRDCPTDHKGGDSVPTTATYSEYWLRSFKAAATSFALMPSKRRSVIRAPSIRVSIRCPLLVHRTKRVLWPSDDESCRQPIHILRHSAHRAPLKLPILQILQILFYAECIRDTLRPFRPRSITFQMRSEQHQRLAGPLMQALIPRIARLGSSVRFPVPPESCQRAHWQIAEY